MKLVVGLGNPGRKYDGTRHNIGFMVIDGLASGIGVSGGQNRFDGTTFDWLEGSERILLLKPETFMNLSGRAVRQAMDFYQIDVKDVLVICDDVAIPLGKLRFRARGTHGGHNGLRDIQNHLGTTEYARLRIGVDTPKHGEMADYVLSRFASSERPVIEDALAKAMQGVVLWVRQGIDACMNQYNS